MICKHCQKEMPEVGEFCPFCGAAKEVEEVTPVEELVVEEVAAEETAEVEIAEEATVEAGEEAAEGEVLSEEAEPIPEEAPKKKLPLRKLLLVIGGGVVLLAILTFAILFGMGVDMKPRGNNLQAKSSYSVDDTKLVKSADTVVATMGDKKLTVSELQLHYRNSIYNFYSQSYYYLAYMGLDMAKPLDEQPYYADETMTWEQYFLDAALKSWESYTVVQILAEQEGFTVPAELQAQLDAMPEQLKANAEANGYESVDAFLSDQMGAGVNYETYEKFNYVYYLCNEYINSMYTNLAPTQEEIDAYYAENEATFVANGITKDMGLISDVRHILIQPEGGTTDETGATVYTEEEWAAALEEAEQLLAEWKAGEATEESFAALVAANTDDTGSASTGGLYQDINLDSSYVPEFLEWSISADRKSGDTEIVKTTYGYHIMYFVQGEDYFSYTVSEQLVAERIQLKVLAVRDANPIDVNYKKIVLGEVTFG